MNTGPVRDAQQKKLCVYNIPCDCGRCYIGETDRPLEVFTMEHKYNLTQVVLEKSKFVQHAYEEGHEVCWKEAEVLQEGETKKGKKRRKRNMKQKGTNETNDKMETNHIFFPAILSTAAINVGST
jgi:predicted GIY-YIG superfamily endonuclease